MRAAVNRRSPNAGAIAGRLTNHAKRLDCGGFSTALVSNTGMIPQNWNSKSAQELLNFIVIAGEPTIKLRREARQMMPFRLRRERRRFHAAERSGFREKATN